MTPPDRTPATWHLTPEQRRVALDRRLRELRAWRERRTHDLPEWSFTFPGTHPVPLHLGDAWPQVDIAVAGGPVVFETGFVVPDGFDGAELELDVGGEGLVTLSTGISGGLNPYHRRFALQARPGERVSVRVEAVPKGLFGTPSEDTRLKVARLVVPEPDVAGLCLDLEVLLDAARLNADHPSAAPLLSAAEDALAGLTWPSDADGYLGRLGSGVVGDMGSIWNPPPPRAAQPLADEVLEAVRQARASLNARLNAIRAHLPPVGALALSGHAHLDLAWLWPLAETKRKGTRTFQTVLHLMDEFPDWTFNQSSAQLYAWMEAEQPDVFARIRQRVQEGRLEPVGGMWVEPDCAMTGGESLSRQLLYGQQYFQSRFGRRSTVAWLPDTFGFSGALPQLLQQAGITGFFTTKLTWNETTAFPHDLWWWEGQDGSRVLAHSFKNDSYGAPALGSYNGDIAVDHVLRVLQHDRSAGASGWRGQPPEILFTFGLGDGAGGPSAEMLRRYERLRDFPGLPRLRHTRVDDFFQRLPREGLPVWVGELYFELHRGTLSSQAAIKHLNRQAEGRLTEADAALALASWQGQEVAGAKARLETQWKTLLLNQFHDILPGSSIHEVYAEAAPQLQEVVQQAQHLAVSALKGAGDGWTVWNPSLFPRPLRVTLPVEAAGMETGASPLPAQAVEGGTLVIAPDITVPPLGSVQVRPGGATAGLSTPAHLRKEAEGYWLDNGLVRARVSLGGRLDQMFFGQRAVFGPEHHRLVAFHDVPRNWEAWDINPDTQDSSLGEVLPGGEIVAVEDGPLRVAVTTELRWRSSRIRQTFSVTAGSARLDVRTQVDWRERRTLLRACLDVNARSDHATFETAFGLTRRPTHRNALADAAKFEGVAHRFADLSEPGFGLALLNDGKYGHSAYGSTLSLTLLRGPMYPDPLADLGAHGFTYSLLPHGGDWVRGGVLEEAGDLNSPLVALPGSVDIVPPFRLAGLPVALGTLKPAEDGQGLILRVYEPYGARGELHVITDPHTQLRPVNLLEDDLDESITHSAEPEAHRWTVAVRPFQVLNFRLIKTN